MPNFVIRGTGTLLLPLPPSRPDGGCGSGGTSPAAFPESPWPGLPKSVQETAMPRKLAHLGAAARVEKKLIPDTASR
jgi:hypothetical protein